MKSLEARKREALYWISGLVWTLAVLLFIVLSEVESLEDAPAVMEANTLYYALSTIAQCAAALAALIGLLGMWRLDRLREEEKQCDQEFLEETMRQRGNPPTSFSLYGRESVLDLGRQMINDHPNEERYTKLRRLDKRLKALPDQQWWQMFVLAAFLVVTLVLILAPAIVGIVHIDWVKAWAWTPWLLYIGSGLLAIAPTFVVLLAARSTRILVALALLLISIVAKI